jgi:SAM-dependent methyltransferase
MYDRLARFYDQIHSELVEDIPFSLALAQEADGRVLELGCGTGRLLWPLAEYGVDVVGVDNSAEMLAIAQQHLEASSPTIQQRIKLVSADMTRLSLSLFDFSLALLSYNTALHLDKNALLATLRSVAAQLQPGSQFCIDCINPFLLADLPDTDTPEVERVFIEPETGAKVTQSSTNRGMRTAQTVTIGWHFLIESADGQQQRMESAEIYHYHYPHEWQTYLSKSQFKLSAMWGDYDRTLFDEDSPRLILLAQRT